MFLKIKLKLISYLKLTRPIGWAPFYFALLFGLIDSGFSSLSDTYLALLIYGPLLAGGIYVLNFYSDIEVDKISKITKDIKMSEQPFVTGKVSRKEGLIFAVILMASGLFLSYAINVQLFIISIIFVFVGIIYSFPPRLKQIPLADVFANSFAGSLCYIAGWVIFKDFFEISVYPVLWIFFLIASTYLLTVIIDIDEDRQSGIKTTAVFLGMKKTVQLSFYLHIISVILFIIVLTKQLSLAYLFLIPLMIKSPYSFYKLCKDNSRVYSVGKKSVLKSIMGIFVLLFIYSFLSIIGLDDKILLEELMELL